jgi:hypothetical protein
VSTGPNYVDSNGTLTPSRKNNEPHPLTRAHIKSKYRDYILLPPLNLEQELAGNLVFVLCWEELQRTKSPLVKSLHSISIVGGSTTCVRNHLKTQHFKHEKVVKDFRDLVNVSWKSGIGSIRSVSKECNMTMISQVVHPMFLVTAEMPHTIESVTNHLVMLVCANIQLINLVLSNTSMNFLKLAFPSLHAVIPGRTKLAGIIKN